MSKQPENKCLLSVAMIMKNEEHNLERALGSIRPYVDEIIVVDTGSTDNSVEIAKKYTDKVYFHEWRDDFSEARNYSLQFPTCEWVLIYDADEEVKEDFGKIREFLASLPKDVNTVYLPTISYLDWDLKRTEVASTARIFRNGTVRYENIVHNQPIYKGKVVEAPFIIYHYGYIWTRKLKQKKYERTRNLLVKLLNEKKDMSNIERIYYLCQLYKTESMYESRYNKYPIVEEIFSLVEKEQRINSIGFEVFFLHGLDLMSKGLYDLAERMFKLVLSLNSNNPDPYYGLLGIDEARKEFDKLIPHGEKFFEQIKDVEEHPEKYGWTIITIKYKASARTLLCIGYLKAKRLKEFKENYYLIFEEAKKTGEDLPKLLKSLAKYIIELDNEDYASLSEEIDKLLLEASQLGVRLNILDFIEKDLESGRTYNVELYRPHVKSKFEDYVLKRLESGNDYLLDYILGEDKIEGIKKYGLGSLIFYFENFKGETTEKLKLLNEIRKSEDETLKGVSLALIGDTYLKMGNFKLALDYYKRSIDTLPELGKFIKPVLEDLKTKLDTEIDGAFEEIKEYYTKAKEFFTDLSKEFNVEELKKIYLISDSDFAKYVSSVYLYDSNIDKAKQFLEKIENKDKFYFYNFRLAKIFEKSENQEDLRKAYELHVEACKKNFNLADLGIGIYKFDGFYPSEKIGSPNDEIVWVGNISEKHSGLGVISPIRAWKKANNYYYAYPFPKSEVLKVYKERLKSYKLPKFSVGMEDLLKSLNELNVNEISLLEDDEELKKTITSAVKEIGIEYKENSESIVSFELLNTEIEISKILSKYKSGLLFYFVPNFENKSDIAWYYPLFRVFRNRKAINDELEKLSIKRIKHIILTGHLRAVIFEK